MMFVPGWLLLIYWIVSLGLLWTTAEFVGRAALRGKELSVLTLSLMIVTRDYKHTFEVLRAWRAAANGGTLHVATDMVDELVKGSEILQEFEKAL